MKETTQDQNFNDHRISTVFHDAVGKNIVIFCHGFRGTNTGPNRFFVRTARQLAKDGISSLRFDQYCSGNSEGDFLNSSFRDWIKITQTIAQYYLKQNYKVALLGQSMGGAMVIAVASEMPELTSIVAWSPDPNIEEFIPPENGLIEEKGQIVQARFWQEAHGARVAEKLLSVKIPMYIVQCTADEYVNQQNQDTISKNAQPHHKVEIFEGYYHSNWTYQQSKEIIDKSVNFLVQCFAASSKIKPL